MMVSNFDMLALAKAKVLYEDKYDELHDALYNYMISYVEGYTFDVGMFEDEVENYLGIRGHKNIVNYIINA